MTGYFRMNIRYCYGLQAKWDIACVKSRIYNKCLPFFVCMQRILQVLSVESPVQVPALFWCRPTIRWSNAQTEASVIHTAKNLNSYSYLTVSLVTYCLLAALMGSDALCAYFLCHADKTKCKTCYVGSCHHGIADLTNQQKVRPSRCSNVLLQLL